MGDGVFGEGGRTYRSTASAPESNGYRKRWPQKPARAGIDPRHLLMTWGRRTTISSGEINPLPLEATTVGKLNSDPPGKVF